MMAPRSFSVQKMRSPLQSQTQLALAGQMQRKPNVKGRLTLPVNESEDQIGAKKKKQEARQVLADNRRSKINRASFLNPLRAESEQAQPKLEGESREDLQVTTVKQNNAWFSSVGPRVEQDRRSSSQISNAESVLIKRASKSVSSKKDLYLAAVASIEQNFDSQVFFSLVS